MLKLRATRKPINLTAPKALKRPAPKALKATAPKALKSTEAQKELRALGSPAGKKASEWFFKTGPGQYGYGDQFIGVKVPQTRLISKKYSRLAFVEISKLLKSPLHEERLLALMILVDQYEKAFKENKIPECKRLYLFYLKHLKFINNWDLVDSSAATLIGKTWYYFKPNHQKQLLKKWTSSKNLWERRVAIISTFYFIRQNQLNLTYQIARQYLGDSEDLIHKATGWMLREAGKKDLPRLEMFLRKHTRKNGKNPPMPRTMLRYALEKFPEKTRKEILAS